MRALILDYGEVLARPQPESILVEMASLAGLDVDELKRRYWQHRPVYDGGALADEYWGLVLAGPPAAAEPTPATISALKDADVRSWMDFRDELWDLALHFRACGGKTAFLSNGVPEIMARLRSVRPLDDYFDAVIVSCEVGLMKPDVRIYELTLDRLGVPASSALFVDDRAENLTAPGQLGMQTLHFRGDASMGELRRWVSNV